MDPITEQDIRSSFINCSKGAAKRLPVPRDLDELPWDDLDFLGWSDPAAPGRCYLVVPGDDGPVGVALRHQTAGSRRAQMCTFCSTTHSGGGVWLMSAPKAGEAGRRGNSVGTYICSDLDCSLYVRRKKAPVLGRPFRDDFDPAQRIAQLRENVNAFVARVSD
ncbi:FBP domain-containing protein [Nakamurella lactea]|uniref:FBP domain-containing protein n=1 Tax=Nakamurella lactea TaxID=459515 RepID=UPI0004045213|nr:FBP domain-containing protein [Nakamurella lactea]